MSFEQTYKDIYELIIKNIKFLLITVLGATILAIVFSSPYFIPPKYESKAVIYPKNLKPYAIESSTEQLLQLLEGNDIRDSLIEKFDLLNHYEISKEDDYYRWKLEKKLESNLTITKTQFESVEIEILDEDPKIARDMVVELINQTNNKAANLHKNKALEEMKGYEQQLKSIKTRIDTLINQIRAYSVKYGILDYIMQSKEVTEGYMNLLEGNKMGTKGYELALELYNNLQDKGRYFHDLHHQMNLEREEYNKVLALYDEAYQKANTELTFTNVVVYPKIADKKAYPVRWLIVLLSATGAFVLSIILLILKQKVF